MKHVVIIISSIALILGVPFLTLGGASILRGDGMDAVTSASVILDAPSGEYVILINREKHTEDKLEEWNHFFKGEDVSYIFEDLVCYVMDGDLGGQTMAESYQSRLPENQMQILSMDATLLLSRAEYGNVDVVILSAEMASAYHAEDLYDKEQMAVIDIQSMSQSID